MHYNCKKHMKWSLLDWRAARTDSLCIHRCLGSATEFRTMFSAVRQVGHANMAMQYRAGWRTVLPVYSTHVVIR